MDDSSFGFTYLFFLKNGVVLYVTHVPKRLWKPLIAVADAMVGISLLGKGGVVRSFARSLPKTERRQMDASNVALPSLK